MQQTSKVIRKWWRRRWEFRKKWLKLIISLFTRHIVKVCNNIFYFLRVLVLKYVHIRLFTCAKDAQARDELNKTDSLRLYPCVCRWQRSRRATIFKKLAWFKVNPFLPCWNLSTCLSFDLLRNHFKSTASSSSPRQQWVWNCHHHSI